MLCLVKGNLDICCRDAVLQSNFPSFIFARPLESQPLFFFLYLPPNKPVFGIEQGLLRLLRTKIARKYQYTTCDVIPLLNLVPILPLLAKTHFVPLTKEII